MESKCLGCRFGSVKVEILVPEKYSMKQFVQQTRDFASDIAALTEKKPIHYSLTFDSGEDCPEKLNFKVDCACILDIKKKDCSKFNTSQDRDCRVTHLTARKTLMPQKIAIPIRQR